ncbi:partner of Y14 and mago [Eurosta solidaginis]|uniref:partner of Y14 and mago n=1 Tax=Eurosta solidaginis TaxID=178769 RepID=UPI0035313E76
MTTYLTDSDGKFIPATQRPDGTWRKARRVKDGYVPQEEVPLYESKGKLFAQRKSTIPPGMCPIVAEQAKKEREKQERAKAKKMTKQQEKAQSAKVSSDRTIGGNNQKKQQMQPQQQTPGMLVLSNASGVATAAPNLVHANANSKTPHVTTSSTNSNEAVAKLANDLEATLKLQADDGQLDTSKKMKKLRKKLREIETIEQRIKSGELKKPEKDQLDKVKRKKEIIKEIQQLENEEAAASAALISNSRKCN